MRFQVGIRQSISLLTAGLILALYSCQAGTGGSEAGPGDGRFDFETGRSIDSPLGFIDESNAILSSINSIASVSLLDEAPEENSTDTQTENEPAASLLATPSKFCIEDTVTPKAQEGETTYTGDLAGTDQLSIDDPKYAARALYCAIENKDSDFSLKDITEDLRSVLCVLQNMKEDNPLNKSELLGTEQEVSFVFSKGCFSTTKIAEAQTTIGSLQGTMKLTKEVNKDGWSEAITFREMNWIDSATEWTVKTNFGDEFTSMAFYNKIGSRENSGEFFILQSDRNGKLYIERQIMLLRTSEFDGTITNFNSAVPYNYRLRLELDSTLERESLDVATINTIKFGSSNLTTYTQSSEYRQTGQGYLVTAGSALQFATQGYTCVHAGDRSCSSFQVFENYTTTPSCAPASANCSESALSFTNETFAGFAMTADSETIGYKTPETQFNEASYSEFKNGIGVE